MIHVFIEASSLDIYFVQERVCSGWRQFYFLHWLLVRSLGKKVDLRKCSSVSGQMRTWTLKRQPLYVYMNEASIKISPLLQDCICLHLFLRRKKGKKSNSAQASVCDLRSSSSLDGAHLLKSSGFELNTLTSWTCSCCRFSDTRLVRDESVLSSEDEVSDQRDALDHANILCTETGEISSLHIMIYNRGNI